MLVRQLEEELRMRLRGPNLEMQNQIEVLYTENEHLTREIGILRDTIKELELRIETQKQTLQARDESIKKLLEMLQNKGVGGSKFPNFPESKFPNIADFESGLSGGARELQFKLLESENIIKHYECLITSRDEELNLTKKVSRQTNLELLFLIF
ncbi:ELKS/Rab6-interacting/CAST family member 1-like [Diaphorina citri]|uniref:ELKS/Rab6-interacting/CAST family member 1-like n=1 Tax=Diaphorina citri TaxID=121845 RepID=A0A1S4EQG9_DIACI|nr:ELKS/Rab6-interacting/CAST family member 1-like [Diaphorina citri]